MASIETNTTAVAAPVRSHRRRWAWITIATVGLLSATAFVAVPAIADNSSSSDRMIVCESGVETDGDIQISAASVTRVADGDTSPVPEGCRVG